MLRDFRQIILTLGFVLVVFAPGFDFALAQGALADSEKEQAQETADSAVTESPKETEPQEEQADGATDGNVLSEEQELDPEALIKELQTALNNHGCNAGRADGIWGRQSLRALERFARHAGLVMKTDPSPEVLAAVKAEPEPVCPPVCGPQYAMRGGKCVPRGCPVGQSPDRRGRCIDTLRICSADCRRKSCGPYIEGWDCKENGISCLVTRCKLSNQAADWHFHNIWVPILNR